MRNYSQWKLGDKADVSQQHISRIENDEVCPTVDTLLKLAKALDVSITTLTEEELLVVEEKCIFEMVKKLELLSMDSKMKVSGYIDCLYQDEMKKFRIKRSKQT
ncbi:MAG: helix-turn-helix transcriptional regulator [Clostridia bacterium]|nr:helix-turn-helix transcriptional regulator [Clostridia bacterium]